MIEKSRLVRREGFNLGGKMIAGIIFRVSH